MGLIDSVMTVMVGDWVGALPYYLSNRGEWENGILGHPSM